MSNGVVKIANQRFCNIKNDFCLVFDRTANIEEWENDDTIDRKGYSFVTMNDIMEAPRQRVVDFIGVVISVGSLADVTLKNGSVKQKRMIKVADESGMTVDVCVWAPPAHDYDNMPSKNPVVAYKAARVVEF